MKPHGPADEVKKIFRKFCGKDKKLQLGELRSVMQKLGDEKGVMTDGQCANLFRNIDLNHDGNVDIDEFLAYIFPPNERK